MAVDIGAILTGGTAGGLFGIFGQIANRWMTYKETKEKGKQDLERFKHEIELQKEARVTAHEANEDAMSLNKEVTESDLARTVVTGSYAGLTESIKADAALKSYKWVDAIKGLMRPGLTLGLTSITCVAYFVSNDHDYQGMTLATIASLTATCVVWWFGDRQQMKLNSKYLK